MLLDLSATLGVLNDMFLGGGGGGCSGGGCSCGTGDGGGGGGGNGGISCLDLCVVCVAILSTCG